MTALLPVSFLASAVAEAETAALDRTPVPLQTAILLVMLVLLAFMGIKLVELGRAVRALEQRLVSGPAPRAAAAATAPAAPAATREGVSVEVAVVIAAAVAATCGRTARIVSVGDASGTIRPWSLEGRRQIFASHSIR